MQHRELTEKEKLNGFLSEEQVFEDFIFRFYNYRSGLTKIVVDEEKKERREPLDKFTKEDLKKFLEKKMQFKVS